MVAKRKEEKQPVIEKIRERWWKWMLVIVATAGAFGVIWALPEKVYCVWPQPYVQRDIDEALKPFVDAQEYQNALMMATMSKEELELAAELYNAGKSIRGK